MLRIVHDIAHRRPTAPWRPAFAGLLLALACLAGRAGLARAQWPPANAGLPVCTASGLQNYRVAVSDGGGGMFIAWSDTRFVLSDIYVQHVSAFGTNMWASNGQLVCSGPNRQDQAVLVPDGTGGVVIAWRDYRFDANGDIFAQRVDASGVAQWAFNGVAVCTAAGQQGAPVIAADSAGAAPCGVVIAWEDGRGTPRIFAQRLDASGAAQWDPDGRPLTTSNAAQFEPTIVTAGGFGTIVGWSQQGATGYDIVAELVGQEGQPLWDPSGAVISGAAGNQFHPMAVTDSASGAWFAWEDDRGTSIGVYAQRVTLPGFVVLVDGGAAVCSFDADQLSPAAAADGQGGLLVAWEDTRVRADVYAQRLDAAGARLWLASGQAVCDVAGGHAFPTIAADNHGGALVAWEDDRGGAGTDIYAQRMDGSGATRWTAGGVGICTASSSQFQPTLVSGPDSVGIVVWVDLRASNDLYCQHVPLQVAGPALAVPLMASPNPAAQQASFAFALAGAGRAELDIYDAAGRRVRTLSHATLAPGAHAVPWDARDDAGRACADGVYFARLAVDGHALATRSITIRR